MWKECQDERTGYSYYWNTKTDEVTWMPPLEIKNCVEHEVQKLMKTDKKPSPPRINREITSERKPKAQSPQKHPGNLSQIIAGSRLSKMSVKPSSDSEEE